MPLALAAFMSVTWVATEPNEHGAAGAGSSTIEKLPFQLQPETSWDIIPGVWATARAGSGSSHPGTPTVKPLLSCLRLKLPTGKLALGQVQDWDLCCPEQSWSLHPGPRWSCTPSLKVLHDGWHQSGPDTPQQLCLPSPSARAAHPGAQQTPTASTSQPGYISTKEGNSPGGTWTVEFFLLLETSYKLSSFFPPIPSPSGAFLTQTIWNLF